MKEEIHKSRFKHLILAIGLLSYTQIMLLSSCKSETSISPAVAPAVDNIDTITSKVWLQDTSFFKKANDSYILPWSYLLDTKLEKAYSDTLGMDVSLPLFSDTLQWLNHKIVTVEGFYIPVDETGDADIVVLSAYPFSQCFFCGKAGVESIIDVMPMEKLPTIKMDQKIKMKGRLRLNREDFNYLIFMLEDAVMIKN